MTKTNTTQVLDEYPPTGPTRAGRAHPPYQILLDPSLNTCSDLSALFLQDNQRRAKLMKTMAKQRLQVISLCSEVQFKFLFY